MDTTKELDVRIDKTTVVELLRERGDHDTAAQAERSLPDHLDADRDRDLLQRFGVDSRQLTPGEAAPPESATHA